ncbi:MAG TPA: mandelate racemase/muconate lactonizing enzyme family protein [Terriglobales bacterium]|nr:mandelate racemase/muconate lactonizing enzyme family protein [Terriglobales bacterium]
MKIAQIEVVTLRHEYPSGKGFKFAGGYCNGRLSCLVFVHTEDGLTGVGSVYSHPGLVTSIIEEHLQPILLGRDPLQVEEIWDLCYRLTRWYGRKGAAVSALGGIDTALWDIRGKAAGKPISQLLGANRSKVPVYASALLWKDDPKELGEEAQRHLDFGFRGMKTRLGRNYDYDREAVAVVRKAIGSGNRLMVEGNARYSLAQAERIAAEYRAAGVFWFEEPFPPEQIDNFLALRPSVGIPLASGENEFGVQGFRELLDQGLVDIVQPDCSRSGGITECYRIGKMAGDRGIRVATHTWSDAVALVANMHLIAALPTGLTVEMDRTGNPFIDELLVEPLQVVDGEVAVPEGPGLGIELDRAALERFRMPRLSTPPLGNYSDMVFGREHFNPAPAYETSEVGVG